MYFVRVTRQGTLDAVYRTNLNRFKNKWPILQLGFELMEK